jgi:uncharacterized protein YutE (UPF0331/DUF86 family)
MDWLQFIASIIGSLAWPAAMVLVVLLLRRAIFRVLPRLRQLKYGDAEAEFGEKLEQVEEEIDELPAPTSLPKKVEQTVQRLDDIGDFSNNSAVFVAWLSIESAILNLARAANALAPNMPALRAAEILLKRQLIDHATFHAIRDLAALRNIAVHPSYVRLITQEEVDRFRGLAEKVAAVLEDRRQSIVQ